jgi:uncharacterized membrane protein
MDPQTAVVVLGIASAVAWGSADFSGGIAGRRAPLLGVILVTQLSGCVLALVLALLRHEPFPAPRDLLIAVVAGAVGVVGIWALYRGLATGRMGVVAPISGVLSAIVPVAVGIVLQGLPRPAAVAGIVLAVLAVILVSSAPGSADRPVQKRVAGLPSDMAIALLAGTALGLLNVIVSRFTPDSVFAPLVLVRLTEAAIMILIIRAATQPWRVPRAVWPLVLTAGGLDMAGNGLFILAAQAYRLDIAAVLSAMYPVSTLILAALVLKERVVGVHAVGVAAALGAIVLLTVRIG